MTHESQKEASAPVAVAPGRLRPLLKGDTVQRGDIFIDCARSFEIDARGFILGVRCLGQTIRKDNGGWYRPLLNAEITHAKPTP